MRLLMNIMSHLVVEYDVLRICTFRFLELFIIQTGFTVLSSTPNVDLRKNIKCQVIKQPKQIRLMMYYDKNRKHEFKKIENNIHGLPTAFYCHLILHFIKCYWQYSFIACYRRLKSQAWCPLHLVNVINWCIWFVISGCTIIKFAIDNNIKFNSNRSSFSRFVITWHTNS